MTRYYKDSYRKSRHDINLKAGFCFEPEQIRDVLALVKNGKFPNADYSDNEVCLYEIFCEELGA